MALTEVALLSLAVNLANNPTATDVQKYDSLNPQDQTRIQQIIEQKDFLPKDLNDLIIRSKQEQNLDFAEHPTQESGTGI